MANLIGTMDGAIYTITINREKQLNALNKETLLGLQELLLEAEEKKARVMIITGAGEKAFVAGADIAEMKEYSAIEAQTFSMLGHTVFSKIEKMSFPVIAAINGYALGGGCELALACDIRVSSDVAKFGMPEVGLGVMPGFGGTQRLPGVVGKSQAKRLILSGEIISAEEAVRIGLVDLLVTKDTLYETVQKMAKRIAGNAPVAVTMAKKALQGTLDGSAGEALEGALFGQCFTTQDQKEGMNAFLEKRKAMFQGK